MRLPRKILFSVLMLVLTFGAIEAMARFTYYVIYDETYIKGKTRLSAMIERTPRNRGTFQISRIRHPYYGYSPTEPGEDLNSIPLRRRDDTVVIGLLGGSVARAVRREFKRAVHQYFEDHDISFQPVVLDLAYDGMKQPQQLMIIAYRLYLDEKIDIIVNLDGHNELTETNQNFLNDILPSFPYLWNYLSDTTVEQLALIGHIRVLRDKQWVLWSDSGHALYRSAMFGLVMRFRFERLENSIQILHHQLVATKRERHMETHGPQISSSNGEEVLSSSVREWYRGSVLLAALAEEVEADYYHFLQPNQYVPDSKPFTSTELETAYRGPDGSPYITRGYPMLIRLGHELKQQGIGFFDLTMIFKGNHETLYRDECCHLTDRGNELLAEQMIQRMVDSFLKE